MYEDYEYYHTDELVQDDYHEIKSAFRPIDFEIAIQEKHISMDYLEIYLANALYCLHVRNIRDLAAADGYAG